MDLVHVTPALDLYDKAWPIRTWQEQLPQGMLAAEIVRP